MADALLKVDNLTTRFAVPGGSLDAVKDASFEIAKGETLALVGESGRASRLRRFPSCSFCPIPWRAIRADLLPSAARNSLVPIETSCRRSGATRFP